MNTTRIEGASTEKLNCYIQAKGEPCETEDEDVPGFYLIELSLSRPLVLGSISDQDRSEIATAALDSFHEHQGIEDLDTFLISVLLEDGTKVEEGAYEGAGLVLNAEHHGKLSIDDVPLTVSG